MSCCVHAVGEAPFSPFSDEGRKRLHTSLSGQQLAELLRSQHGQVSVVPSRSRRPCAYADSGCMLPRGMGKLCASGMLLFWADNGRVPGFSSA